MAESDRYDRRVRFLARHAAVLIAAGVASVFGVDTGSSDDRYSGAISYVLRAGRNYQTLGSLELRDRRRAVTYADAIRVFGRASSCRLLGNAATARAIWSSHGIRLRLTTLGGMPRGKTGCTAPRLIYIESAYVSGSQWQTALGLQVGSSVDELKSTYPRAIFQRRPVGNWPAPAYWIVHVRQRCVIGICRSPYETVPRLAAQIKAGQVAEFFFPVGAQGE